MMRSAVAAGAGLVASAGGSVTAQRGTPGGPPAPTPRAGARGPYVTTADGEELFVRDWGTGTPIVFVAAWALPAAMWDYQMAALVAQGFRCVAYDRRGHGRSSQPGGGYDFDTLADDLHAVIEARGLRGATLVGMSMAGGEITRYLTRHGRSRVSRVVYVATAATPYRTRTADNPDGLPPGAIDAFVDQQLLRDYPQWLEDNRPPFFLPETPRPIQEWVRGLMLNHSLHALAACTRTMAGTDFRAELPRVGVPALVIHGTRDASAPIEVTGRPTAALIPGAHLSVYEGAPHGLFVTHRDRLTADLAAFAGGAQR
jgi:pimeloyl-ACP methyl ester carboxylesterase